MGAFEKTLRLMGNEDEDKQPQHFGRGIHQDVQHFEHHFGMVKHLMTSFQSHKVNINPV